jgi:predicted nucleotidyltransferase
MAESDVDIRWQQRFSNYQRAFAQLAAAIIYGSRAKGNYTPASDIDLTLIGPELTEGQLLQLETWLDDLLLPYSLDISRFHGLQNPALIGHIQRVGQDFYRR